MPDVAHAMSLERSGGDVPRTSEEGRCGDLTHSLSAVVQL